MARKRVANVLVDTLVAAGVKRIYGLAGDSLNGVTDSIRPRKDLQWVPVRHEETAAFAAGLTDLLDSGRAGQESPDAIRKRNGMATSRRRLPYRKCRTSLLRGDKERITAISRRNR